MQGPTKNGKRETGRPDHGRHERAPAPAERPPPAREADDRRGNSRLPGPVAVEEAKAQIMDLTGQPCESVSALSRTRDGWQIVLEVVELERIPRTTDIMASYLVELDDNGELMRYERVGRYYRNEVSGES